ncbi:hypothetical protein [Deinococcus sp.]|uniref:hypothetical protein n=1 Tax=Deinococcus sp. TaxID=47478 RepID=UPI0025F0A5B2|nr:hypothetical protein [Deinococcus sp.]
MKQNMLMILEKGCMFLAVLFALHSLEYLISTLKDGGIVKIVGFVEPLIRSIFLVPLCFFLNWIFRKSSWSQGYN